MRKVIFAIVAAGALAWSSAAWAVLQPTTSTPEHGQPIPGATIKLPRPVPQALRGTEAEPELTPEPPQESGFTQPAVLPPTETPTPAPEIPKEHGMMLPGGPSAPVPVPQGFGVMPLPPVVLPGEVPKSEEVKEKTSSPKPVRSQDKLRTPKKKHKTAVRRAKSKKHVEPGSQKTVEKPSETGAGQVSPRAKRPTATDVTKSLKSQDTGGIEGKPEMKRHTTPSTKKKVNGQSGKTQGKGGQIQEKREGKPPDEPGLKTKGQKGEVSTKAPAHGGKLR